MTDQMFSLDIGLWLPSVSYQVCMLINPLIGKSGYSGERVRFDLLSISSSNGFSTTASFYRCFLPRGSPDLFLILGMHHGMCSL
jgi:hypothetical protein